MKLQVTMWFAIVVVLVACTPPSPTSTPTATLAPTPTTEPTVAPQAADSPGIQIEADPGPLGFLDYGVNEARFNPSVENPAALNMMASLTFQNISEERLEVRSPRFALTIDGVAWTDLASTDFQMGRLQPAATHTIELQSLLLMRQMTDEQAAVLETIRAGEPVDLEITGTILAYPGGEEQTLHVTIRLDSVILPGEWAPAAAE